MGEIPVFDHAVFVLAARAVEAAACTTVAATVVIVDIPLYASFSIALCGYILFLPVRGASCERARKVARGVFRFVAVTARREQRLDLGRGLLEPQTIVLGNDGEFDLLSSWPG